MVNIRSHTPNVKTNEEEVNKELYRTKYVGTYSSFHGGYDGQAKIGIFGKDARDDGRT